MKRTVLLLPLQGTSFLSRAIYFVLVISVIVFVIFLDVFFTYFFVIYMYIYIIFYLCIHILMQCIFHARVAAWLKLCFSCFFVHRYLQVFEFLTETAWKSQDGIFRGVWSLKFLVSGFPNSAFRLDLIRWGQKKRVHRDAVIIIDL